MPELPEVETMRRGIAAVAGSRIAGVCRPRSRLAPIRIAPPLAVLRRRVVGRRIAAVQRLGKRLLLALDDGSCLVIEPRMTGRVSLAEPDDKAHLRLVVRLAGGTAEAIYFWDSRGLGVVRLLDSGDIEAALGPAKLGPDALEVSCAELRCRLAPSRRAIKVALLDQRALAGVGNIYASELLHRAGVHPAMPCNRLRPADWQRVHSAIRAVLAEAVRLQGSTLRDGTYPRGSFQDRHRVYQRAGQPCLQCRASSIVRMVQAQRSTFFCPRCQRPPHAGSGVPR